MRFDREQRTDDLQKNNYRYRLQHNRVHQHPYFYQTMKNLRQFHDPQVKIKAVCKH